ncbi:glutathione S-transferase family protein [Phenylobacterium sp.]|uniref:glutathione S-transferase family protein n=1 Tax=Phenylobacterium sp. TaxID=1871053 RepID=UPI0025F173B9|nr:glutathione S-transferase family protein [Phenylobacterium sp.]MBX3482599.1 glutathione S-transferase family protein [Phenylobacterium sp.]MCW5760469.1 glutathione S-transferase family protein [Phenylobacterium sp.]
MELVIGTKRWSTWSLRPWLVLKRSGLPFTETLVELRQENNVSADRIRAHSPSGLVPVLKDGDLTVWDSLAISEYLAEKAPGLWPADPAARAMARAAAAEMHSGFQALRGEAPMALDEPVRTVELSEATQANVRRLVALWGGMLERFGGPFLAGGWSIADAFYTPVATRVRTYGIDLAAYGDDGRCAAYVARLLATPEFLEWERAAVEG